MITRLKLRGYKCFPELDIELPSFCAIVGPNNAGKSSVLRAIEQLGRTTMEPLEEIFAEPETVSALAWKGGDEARISFGASVQSKALTDASYYLELRTYGSDGSTRLEKEVATLEQNEIKGGWRRVSEDDDDEYTHTSLHAWSGGLKVPDSRLALMASVLGGTAKIRFDPSMLAAPCPIEVGEAGQTAPNGYGLPAVLDFRKGERLSVFLSIQDAFCAAFPEVKEIVVRKKVDRSLDRAQTKATLAFRTTAGFEIPAQLASEGMLLYLGYLTLLYADRAPYQLLIEEPENGNHPRRLGQVINVLRTISEGAGGAHPVQIIMTTHSPYILDFLQPEEVLIATREPGGPAQITPLTSAPDLKERLQDFTLGELVYNVGEQALVGGRREGS